MFFPTVQCSLVIYVHVKIANRKQINKETDEGCG